MKIAFSALLIIGCGISNCRSHLSSTKSVSDTSAHNTELDGEWIVTDAFQLYGLRFADDLPEMTGKKLSIGENTYQFDGKPRCAKDQSEVVPLAEGSKTFNDDPPPEMRDMVFHPLNIVMKFNKGSCALNGGNKDYPPLKPEYYYEREEFFVSCGEEGGSRRLPNQYMRLDEETLFGWNMDGHYFCFKLAGGTPTPPPK